MFLNGFQLPFQYYFKAISKKSHFFLTSNEQVNLSLGDLIIETSKSQKLLGITISLHLTNTLLNCKKASQKLHSIARISSYLNKNKFRLIMNAFFSSQFGYCPLAWIFNRRYDRRYSNKINRLHGRMLRIVNKDYNSSFTELFSEGKSFAVHHKNIQKLAVEMYKV